MYACQHSTVNYRRQNSVINLRISSPLIYLQNAVGGVYTCINLSAFVSDSQFGSDENGVVSCAIK